MIACTYVCVVCNVVMDFFEDDQASDQGPPESIIIPPSNHSWEVRHLLLSLSLSLNPFMSLFPFLSMLNSLPPSLSLSMSLSLPPPPPPPPSHSISLFFVY